jgi:hypothetical protein
VRSFGIVGIPIAGMVTGFIFGFVAGDRKGGDINIAPAIYAPMGALVGGVIGILVAAVVYR